MIILNFINNTVRIKGLFHHDTSFLLYYRKLMILEVKVIQTHATLIFYDLRLPYSLSGVFSDQPITLLICVGYPQTYSSMESL